MSTKEDKGLKDEHHHRLRGFNYQFLQVLMNVCFCRGLSGNNQRRPTCHVYIEIKTHTSARRL
jgi:hypothetical protein